MWFEQNSREGRTLSTSPWARAQAAAGLGGILLSAHGSLLPHAAALRASRFHRTGLPRRDVRAGGSGFALTSSCEPEAGSARDTCP